MDAYEAVHTIVNSSGMLTDLKSDKSQEGISRLQNIDEMLNGIREFIESRKEEGFEETVTLVDYLENVALLTDQDTDKEGDTNRVSVMTVHSAKGLEFDYVFLTGLEDNLFPSTLNVKSPEDLEEERRLFYVALTRAAKRAYITYAQTRYRWGSPTHCTPSRFIKEIDSEYIDVPFDEGDHGNIAERPYSKGQSFSGFTSQSSALAAPSYTKPNQQVPTTPKNTRDISPEAITVGMSVYHVKFGEGVVESIEGAGPNRKALVNFNLVGSKNLLLKFANLKQLE